MSIKGLLEDIAVIGNKNISVRVVEWSEDKKLLQKKKRLYFESKKKIKDLKIYYQKSNQKSNFEYKYSLYINKFNSKYITMIGDDDRLNIENFKKILSYLNYNFSGITSSFVNYRNSNDLKKKTKKIPHILRTFSLENDINRIGYISCHFFKTELIKNIYKEEKKNLLISRFPQNFLIIKINKKFKNWKVSNLECIYNSVGNIDFFIKNPEDTLLRLKSEYIGYLVPLLKNYPNFNNYKMQRLYKRIFFKNIISWLYLSIKLLGKQKTFKNITEERKIISEPTYVKIILIFMYVCPIFLLNILRILRKHFIK